MTVKDLKHWLDTVEDENTIVMMEIHTEGSHSFYVDLSFICLNKSITHQNTDQLVLFGNTKGEIK